MIGKIMGVWIENGEYLIIRISSQMFLFVSYLRLFNLPVIEMIYCFMCLELLHLWLMEMVI